MLSSSRVIWRWLLRGYVLFLALFFLGAGWMVLEGVDGGLLEAGGTLSVLSGWLLWGLMMVPLVGATGLAIGVTAWLLLPRNGRAVSALSTGAVAALAVAGIGVWFAGTDALDLAGLVVLGALAGVGAAAVTVRDARGLRDSAHGAAPFST